MLSRKNRYMPKLRQSTDVLTIADAGIPTATKAIFLDIEGVIVTHRSILANFDNDRGDVYHGAAEGWESFIDKTAMGLIYKLADELHAPIVLTSTLRGKPCTYDGLMRVAPEWAKHTATDYVCEEHTLRLNNNREAEIREFASRHNVLRYIVIDDRDLQIENFVHCDPRDGFNFACYDEARHLLCDDNQVPTPEMIFL